MVREHQVRGGGPTRPTRSAGRPCPENALSPPPRATKLWERKVRGKGGGGEGGACGPGVGRSCGTLGVWCSFSLEEGRWWSGPAVPRDTNFAGLGRASSAKKFSQVSGVKSTGGGRGGRHSGGGKPPDGEPSKSLRGRGPCPLRRKFRGRGSVGLEHGGSRRRFGAPKRCGSNPKAAAAFPSLQSKSRSCPVPAGNGAPGSPRVLSLPWVCLVPPNRPETAGCGLDRGVGRQVRARARRRRAARGAGDEGRGECCAPPTRRRPRARPFLPRRPPPRRRTPPHTSLTEGGRARRVGPGRALAGSRGEPRSGRGDPPSRWRLPASAPSPPPPPATCGGARRSVNPHARRVNVKRERAGARAPSFRSPADWGGPPRPLHRLPRPPRRGLTTFGLRPPRPPLVSKQATTMAALGDENATPPWATDVEVPNLPGYLSRPVTVRSRSSSSSCSPA